MSHMLPSQKATCTFISVTALACSITITNLPVSLPMMVSLRSLPSALRFITIFQFIEGVAIVKPPTMSATVSPGNTPLDYPLMTPALISRF